MRKYDFNTVIDRSHTGSVKWDFAKSFGMPEGLIPLWVADMDFPSPPCVGEALKKLADHGIYGYTDAEEDYYQAVLSWYRNRFGWNAKREWIVKVPGVVFGIAASILAFTEKEDAVLIQRPVYYPFTSVIEKNGRRLVNSPLIPENGKYRMDFADLEEKIRKENVKLMILCSPHNPVGRVWTKEELQTLGMICAKHHVIVVSDEIHSDFIRPGHTHTVFAEAGEGFSEFSVICTAPSKTFNLAGFSNSNLFIADRGLRRRMKETLEGLGGGFTNIAGIAACKAVYTEGEEWLAEAWCYIQDNIDFMKKFLSENIPQIKMIEPEGTYLVWLDCREVSTDENVLNGLFVKKAGIWPDAGGLFGPEGEGFMRLNAASPRKMLEAAMEKLAAAMHPDFDGRF